MLVLMRKAGESIMIGDNILVTIVCVNGNQVRMAIAAPKAVPVDREEIYIRKRESKKLNAAPELSFENNLESVTLATSDR